MDIHKVELFTDIELFLSLIGFMNIETSVRCPLYTLSNLSTSVNFFALINPAEESTQSMK